MTRGFFAGLGALALLCLLPLAARFLRGPPPRTASVPFLDSFDDRGEDVGSAYRSTGGLWRIERGQLLSPGVKNNPLWLQASLPADVRVSFDARAVTPNGDIKCEIFGNGWDHASGYVLVLGGWGNTVSVLARLDEHGKDRLERTDFKVDPNHWYHFDVERKGSRLSWKVDGQEFLALDDPKPLRGPDHDRFGLSSWESDVFFDNLVVTPL